MQPTSFTTEVHRDPDVASMRVEGRVTHDDASQLRQELLGELGQSSGRVFVVELSGVETLDTAGAAVLVEALAVARRRDIRLLLCSPSDSVTGMFRLAGFEEILEACCATPEETRSRVAAATA